MEEDVMIQSAMSMILSAGDARNYIKEALDATMNDDDELATSKMNDAKKALEEAHRVQTDIVQKDAGGERAPYSLLFTHAQDTLMTIMSEKHLAEKMIEMYKKLKEK